MKRTKKTAVSKGKPFDKHLLVITICLTIFGLIAVADASAPMALKSFNDKFYFIKQQSMWAVAGLIGLFVCANIRYQYWQKVGTLLFAINLLLLLIVLIPGVGLKILGARRWIDLGFTTLQPSEFIKLTLAMHLAIVASVKKKPIAFFAPVGLVAAFVMLQPDLGTTIIISLIAFVQIFIAGIPLGIFLGAGVVGGAASLILILTSDYRRERLMTFFEITSDPLGKSYHIRQILLALGSGGLFGLGVGHSRQKYLFLPETATDSIFAVIAEEIGFLGATVLIILILWFVLRALAVARYAPDTFSQILSVGIVAWIGGQAFLNIAAMVALVPLTGIPLPFFSYGGSSLVTVLSGVGILLNISRYTQRKRK